MSPRRSFGLFNNKFTFCFSFFEVNKIKKGRVLKIFSLGPLPIQDCLLTLFIEPGNSREVFPSTMRRDGFPGSGSNFFSVFEPKTLCRMYNVVHNH